MDTVTHAKQRTSHKSQQQAEEDTKYDQDKQGHVRSFILTLDASTQTFKRPDIHARFQHSPEEQACQPHLAAADYA